MSFFSGITSAISSIGSAIGKGIAEMGSALSSFASSAAPVIGAIVARINPVAGILLTFATALLQGMGILRPGEKPDDMGERALQAAERGIKPEKFDRFDQYMDELRKFEIDPEKALKRSPAEKLVAGLAIGTVGLEDKFHYQRGTLNTLWALPIANPDFFTPERVQSLISSGRFAGDVFAYLEKRLAGVDAQRMRQMFEDGLGESAPDSAKAELYQNLDKAQTAWEKLQEELKKEAPSQDAQADKNGV